MYFRTQTHTHIHTHTLKQMLLYICLRREVFCAYIFVEYRKMELLRRNLDLEQQLLCLQVKTWNIYCGWFFIIFLLSLHAYRIRKLFRYDLKLVLFVKRSKEREILRERERERERGKRHFINFSALFILSKLKSLTEQNLTFWG